MTPEGRVKKKVKDILAKFGDRVYYEMPVPGGYGKSGLDFCGCAGGKYFAVETKANDKQPTDRQKQRIREITKAGGKAFAIINMDDPDLLRFEEWLVWQVGPANVATSNV